MTSNRDEVRPIDTAARVTRAAAGAPPLLTSQTIFRGAREATIEHNGEVYRLRITSNDKLILTK